MPMYDYRCQSCGARFEVWQKMSDAPVDVCPTCSGHVQRVIHATGLLFKGSGFYITDTRGAGVAAAPEAHEGQNGKEGQNGHEAKEGATAGEARSESRSDETNHDARREGVGVSGVSKAADGKGATSSSTTSTASAQAG